jgi:hypothetical protein
MLLCSFDVQMKRMFSFMSDGDGPAEEHVEERKVGSSCLGRGTT